MSQRFFILVFFISFASCKSALGPEETLFADLVNLEALQGKKEYLASPFVAAGDRVYLIGNQNGAFQDMGWHVEGEMGGIWLHPIKLMDGFTASVSLGNDTFCLDQAEKFTNYPFANKHQFLVKEAGLEVERLQFVPDGKEGMTILFRVKNVDTSDKTIQFQFHAFVDLMPVWLGERTQLIDYPDAISFDSNTATFSAKDQGNPWFTVWGTKEGLLPQPSQALNCNYSPKGDLFWVYPRVETTWRIRTSSACIYCRIYGK